MRLLLAVGLVAVCLFGCLVQAAPLSAEAELAQDVSQPRMSEVEADAYRQWIQAQTPDNVNTNLKNPNNINNNNNNNIAYSQFDSADEPALEVQCPVGTRGLAIPPKHRNFWKSHRMTSSLVWAGQDRFMCVPLRMRGSLRPLIMKLKREEIIEIDPLTRPSLLRGIQEGVEDDVEVRPIRPRMPRRRMPTHEEEQEGPVRERMPRRRMPTQEEEQEAMMMEQMAINDMQMQMQMENEEEFLTQGKRGRGGWGGYGIGLFVPAFGWGGYGLGYGGWGYPIGLGWGGWGGFGGYGRRGHHGRW